MTDNINIFIDFYNEIEKRVNKFNIDDKSLRSDISDICKKYSEDLFLENGIKINKSPFSETYTYDILNEDEINDFIKNKKKNLENEKIKKMKEQEKESKIERIRASIHPDDMFIIEKSKYSKFDENGFPTHDFNGKELTKKYLNRLVKEQEEQKKLYNKYH